MDETTHERIVKRYWDLWEQVRSDPEYARLRSELEAMGPQYEAILASLSEEEQLILDRCITLRETMNRRMLEWACSRFPPVGRGHDPADQVG